MARIIGLTGSIGMGKSTVAAMLADEGLPLFDADAVVRRLQAPGGALVPVIEAAFPGSVGPQGIDRDALGAQVFGDAAALARLEAIVHPVVAAARADFLVAHRDSPLIVFDIPLLFETGGEASVDIVLVVSAPAEVQRARVLARPGMTAEKFDQIVSLQTPDADKRARADHIIMTDQPLAITRAAVAALVAQWRADAAALASPE